MMWSHIEISESLGSAFSLVLFGRSEKVVTYL